MWLLVGQNGVFEITAVHTERMTVDVKLVSPVGEYGDLDIPWGAVLFLDDEKAG